MTDANTPTRHHETQLALVLNGGVSLAVWMGGVTHELDLLRRASSGIDSAGAVADEDRPVFEIWERLARNAGTKVSIDIVSGTSAGGLNGLLLATALARGSALPNLRSVWQESAALDQLLKPLKKPVNSVLRGEAFEAKMRAALNTIGDCAACPQQPVTLFITATALDGRSKQFSDGFGAVFDVRDHRRLYRFQQGERVTYTKNTRQTWDMKRKLHTDFDKANDESLVLAARATASFPMAFGPVSESLLMKYRQEPPAALGFPASCVMDGGVLNNAPFGPVLDAITRRKIDLPVRRVVVFIVPSAGRVPPENTKDRACDEIKWYAAGMSAIRYPAEVNFRTGAEDLAKRLASSIRDRQLDLFQRMANDSPLDDTTRKVAADLLPEYRRNRARSVLYDVRKRMTALGVVNCLSATPEAERKWVDEVLGEGREEEGTWERPNWVPRNDAGEITRPCEGDRATRWSWGLSTAERVLQCLIGHLHQPLDVEQGGKLDRARGPLSEGAEKISEKLREVLAMTDAVNAELLTHARGEEVADEGAARLYQRVFDDLNVPEKTAGIILEAANHYIEAVREATRQMSQDSSDSGTEWAYRSDWDANSVVSACLAVEVLCRTYAPPAEVVEPLAPQFDFLRLGPDNISPLFDEDRYDGLGDRKLFGIKFEHFGAFIDAEWRRSDFAWGRLDGAHHLLYLLPGLSNQDRRSAEVELHLAILRAEAPKGPTGELATARAARAWMEGNLQKQQKSSHDLLETVYRGNDSAKETLKDVMESVGRLLKESGKQPARGPVPRWARVWETVVAYGECVLDPFLTKSDLAGKENRKRRWIRRLTRPLRRSISSAYQRDPTEIPREAKKGLKRTALTVLAGVLVIIAVAFAVALALGLVLGMRLG
ncbi:patatin-like protein [Streptomyces sp. ISID311]|uniref:patatin-like protein n=1 Tax=Streptomyces sp. ISID311 TaxID=2601673 RepID=UPI00164A44A9|nr:patatin-like protein [Streptomyces sp. ISID311]